MLLDLPPTLHCATVLVSDTAPIVTFHAVFTALYHLFYTMAT
jgi:hypothetical protein